MQLRHGHVVFYVLNLFALFFLMEGGGLKIFFDTWCIMHDAGYTLLNAVPTPPSLWSYPLCLKIRLFCICAYAWCHIHFFHHVKFYFWFRKLIGFLVWGQLRCWCQGCQQFLNVSILGIVFVFEGWWLTFLRLVHDHRGDGRWPTLFWRFTVLGMGGNHAKDDGWLSRGWWVNIMGMVVDCRMDGGWLSWGWWVTIQGRIGDHPCYGGWPM